jgi:ribose 1,5-bisphosphokinase PhnN
MSMTSNLLTNPQYWRDRAEEIRVLAERSTHPETKRMLENIVIENIAIDYERLALRTEERLRESRQDACG